MSLHIAEPRTRHWTLAEYYRLAEEGYFRGQRVQLVEGEIINMPPQGHAHYQTLSLIAKWLAEAFGPAYWVRTQAPMNVSPDSDPEPDIAIVRGPIEQYQDHPQTALLVVEIADSSLRLDRRKAAIYAAAGVEEYWIVNLAERCVEMYRHPTPAASAPAAYPPPTVADENQTISPLSQPRVSAQVADLLP